MMTISAIDTTRHGDRRSALTLIELMVALAVISILAGIALPTVKATLEGQKLNRAAQLLQSAIEEGRARAIAGGGGGGIIIDRVGGMNISDRCESTQIRFATVSDPYTGDAPNSAVLIGVNNGGTLADYTDDTISIWFGPSAIQAKRSLNDFQTNPKAQSLINIGDYVQLDDGGLQVRIVDMGAGSVATRNSAGMTAAHIADAATTNWVWMEVERQEPQLNLTRFVGQNKSFSITRSPRPAIAMPVELPRGTSIDLTGSGIGRFGNQFSPMAIDGNYIDTASAPFLSTASPTNYQSIYVLFGRRGEVSRVLGGGYVSGVLQLVEIPVTGDLFFLVGERGQVKTDPGEQLEDQDSNPLGDGAKDGTTPILSQDSLWVAIKARTGDVIASPWIDPTDASTSLLPPPITPLTNASRQTRIQEVLGRVRSAAVASRDAG
ncbi:hypothetical protein K227x_44310 [Rubripirellula lacrimiformis]|uniref:Uncharacterized protein n=1 Tax=Rubripirellula lacrimiformis TaxID=1930273 RepID=A0A517NFW2_9BACT|nr:prepilin-type N-terminal cleavage/methylation domain-containing protein [Rubripirellula lacrimiformis]QDT06024.1 hypothetical protein K227x_44310 [Rubripirellula lacrimiformis]